MSDEDALEELGVLDAIATTRAIRRFTDEAVPDEALAEMLFAASRAPSGSNRQGFRFLVLRDGPAAAEARAVLGQSARVLWNLKRSHDRYDEGSGADPSSPKARMRAAMHEFVEGFERVPVIVLPCMVRHRPGPEETIGASVYPACQNLLLAARALGYGGVLTTWHAACEPELRRLLGIPDDVFVAATIALGRPRGRHGPVRRRPLGELVFEDRWGEAAEWAVDPPGTRHTTAGPGGRAT